MFADGWARSAYQGAGCGVAGGGGEDNEARTVARSLRATVFPGRGNGDSEDLCVCSWAGALRPVLGVCAGVERSGAGPLGLVRATTFAVC